MSFTFGGGKSPQIRSPRHEIRKVTHCDYTWSECRPCKICNRDVVKCPVCGEVLE